MAQTHQLSRAAYDRLVAEHDDLTTRGRIEIAQAIERARELGDLSENGDYHAAKDQQGHMEGRIRQLETIIENADIVEPGPEGVAAVGTVVTIVYDGDDDDMAERYLLGHVEERTGDLDVISPGSPLGAALVGTAEGETVAYAAPNGELRVRVVKVERI
jgi:transcription elongation factor GreA